MARLTSFVFFVITAVIPAFLAEAQGPAPPRLVITANDFVGDYTGTCYRQMDRATGEFRLSLRNGKAGVNGILQHTGGDTVIAKYGPIKFGKGQMKESDLVLVNRGGANLTHVSKDTSGKLAFNYKNPGAVVDCTGWPVGVAPMSLEI